MAVHTHASTHAQREVDLSTPSTRTLAFQVFFRVLIITIQATTLRHTTFPLVKLCAAPDNRMHHDSMARGFRCPVILRDMRFKSRIDHRETYLYLCDPFVIHEQVSLDSTSLQLVVRKTRLKIAQETPPSFDGVGSSHRQPFEDPLPILSRFAYSHDPAKAPWVEIQHSHFPPRPL